MALCTAAQVRAYANAGSSGDDTLIGDIIGRVNASFARWCGYPLTDAGGYTMESATYTRYVDARYMRDPDQPAILFVDVAPVSAVTSVHIDPERDYGADTLQAADTYDLDTELGAIVLRDDATDGWSTAVRANKLVITAGWDTVPDDLEEAAIIQAVHMFRNRASAGNRTTGTEQNTRTVDRLGLLDEVKDRLQRYRLTVP